MKSGVIMIMSKAILCLILVSIIEAVSCADVLLELNQGDEAVVKDTVNLYTGKYKDRRRMTPILMKSSQLLLIPMLAGDLYSNEEVRLKRYGSEFIDYPRSVTTSAIMLRILLNSSEFNDEIGKWAKEWDGKPSELSLKVMRAFWEKNKIAFQSNAYKSVVPPDITFSHK